MQTFDISEEFIDDSLLDDEIIEDPIEDIPQVSEDNIFKIIASDMGFDFEGDDDVAFKDALRNNAKNELLQEIEDEGMKSLIDFALNGGDVSKYIESIQSIPEVDSMKDEDVYKAYLKHTTNFSDQKIQKLILKSVEDDDYQDDVQAARDYFKSLRDKSVEEKIAQQKRLAEQHRESIKRMQSHRTQILNQGNINGVQLTKSFNDFYNQKSVSYKHTDGNTYKITPYEKYMIDIQQDEAKRVEYEILGALATYDRINKKETSESKKVNELKDKLRTVKNSMTTRIK